MRGLFVVTALAAAAIAAAGTARAEDFTGFYAGVNAGYAFGHDERDGGWANRAPPGRPTAASLPPSAFDAARAIITTPRLGTQMPPLPR